MKPDHIATMIQFIESYEGHDWCCGNGAGSGEQLWFVGISWSNYDSSGDGKWDVWVERPTLGETLAVAIDEALVGVWS